MSLPKRLPESTGQVVTVDGITALNSALTSAPNGARIQLRGGRYEGVVVSRTASSTAPITLEPTPGEHVVFAASSTNQYPLRISGRYIRIRGIEITDPAGKSSAHVYFLGQDSELDHVDIHGNGTVQAVNPDSGVSGIFSSSSSARLQVWYSRIHDVGVSENADHGWYMEGTGHALIGSLLYGMTVGYGVQIYPVASNCVVAGNTIVDNSWKAGILVGGTDVRDCLFVNNVVAFSNPSDYAIRGYNSGTNNVIRDSLLWSPSTIRTGAGGIVVGANIRELDPKFQDRAAHNYRPASGSPMIGTGDSAYCPPEDVDGNTRAVASVGAY